MRAVGIIPARYSSRRFPGKALATLLGKPLILWVAEGAARAKMLERIVVATDDERIAEAVESQGFEVAMTSPDLRSGSDRVWEAARGMEADVVVNVQGDEAAVTGEVIDLCVRQFAERDDIDVVTLRTPILDNEELRSPHAVKVVTDAAGFALYFSRSPIPHPGDGVQEERMHFRHVGIYAYKREALSRFCGLPPSALERQERLEQLRGLEAGLRYFVVETSYRGIEVNTPADLEMAEAALRELKGEK